MKRIYWGLNVQTSIASNKFVAFFSIFTLLLGFISFIAAPAQAASGEVAGSVSIQGSGEPVEGVEIELCATVDFQNCQSTLTDPSGYFRIAGIAAGDYRAVASAYGFYTYSTTKTIGSSGLDNFDVVLAAEEQNSLTVSVLDGSNNAQIDNAVVFFETYNLYSPDYWSIAAELNPDGTYSIPSLPAVSGNLVVSASGFADNNTQLDITQGENSVEIILDSDLQATASLDGSVVTTSSAAVPNVSIGLSPKFHGGEWRWSSTNENGEFLLNDLIPGRYSVEISKSGFYPKRTTWTVVNGANSFSVELTAISTNTLSGKVKDAVTAAGQWATVQACASVDGSQYCAPQVETDSNGNYSISGMPAGQADISVWPTQGKGRFFYNSTQANINSGSNVLDLKVKGYPAGDRVLSGNVSTPAGRAIANAQISIYGTQQSTSYSVVSNSSGAYSVSGLPAGTYQLQVWADGYVSAAPKTVTISTSNVTFNLKVAPPATGRISGTISDSEGNLLANATISACSAGEFAICANAYTNDEGFYSVSGLFAGSVTFRIQSPGYRPGLFTIPSFNGVSFTQNYVLESYSQGSGQVSGIVTDAEGNPFDGAVVNVSIQVSSSGENDQFYTEYTGTNGRYSLSGLPAGNYNVTIQAADGYMSTMCSKYFTLKNSSKSIDCQIFNRDAQATVTAQDQNGNPISFLTDIDLAPTQISFQVDSTDPQSETIGTWGLQANSDGSLTLEGLPNTSSGKLLIENVAGSKYFAQETSSIELDLSSGTANGTITLRALPRGGNSVHGKLHLRSDSSVLANNEFDFYSWFFVDSTYFAMNGIGTSDDQGNYQVTGLIPGSMFSINSSRDNFGGSVYGSSPLAATDREINVFVDDLTGQVVQQGNGIYSAYVVDEEGLPIPYASVEVSSPTIGGFTMSSNSQGFIEFTGLSNGEYQVRVLPQGNALGLVSPVTIEVTDDWALTDQVLVAKLMPTGSSVIAGQLYDPLNNTGFSNFTCQVQLAKSDLVQNVDSISDLPGCEVDEFGNYSISDLMQGWYVVQFQDSGELANGAQAKLPETSLYLQVDGTETVNVPRLDVITAAATTTSSIDLKVLDKTTRLKVDENTTCDLNANNVFGSKRENTSKRVNAAGHAVFTNLIPTVEYVVSCSNGQTSVINPFSGAKYSANNSVQNFTLYIETLTLDGNYSGVITDEDGNPVEGAHVGLGIGWAGRADCRCGDGYEAGDITDATGHYYVEKAPVGPLVLSVFDGIPVAPTSYSRFTPINRKFNSVSGVHEMNIQVKLGGVVQGQIFDAADSPATDIQLLLAKADTGEVVAWNTGLSEGHYIFGNMVELGDYVIWVNSWSNSNTIRQGYLQPNGTVSMARSTAYRLTVSQTAPAITEAPTIRLGTSGSISGTISFVDSTGAAINNKWISGSINLWTLDNGAWVKNPFLEGWFNTGTGGTYRIDALTPGTYKVEFKSYGSGEQFANSFAGTAGTNLSSATTFTVVAGQETKNVNATTQFAKPGEIVQAIAVNDLSADQLDSLSGVWSVSQSGGNTVLSAPEDLAGKWVALSYADANLNSARLGVAVAAAPAKTDWLQVNAAGKLTLPAGVTSTVARTLVISDSKQIPVGVANVAAQSASVAPSFATKPSVTGKAKAGKKLTGWNGVVAGTPAPTMSYQWFACAKNPTSGTRLKSGWKCTAIARATGRTFTTSSKLVGKYMVLKVTASNSAGTATWFAESIKVSW